MFCRLRKRIRFGMPGTPLSALQKRREETAETPALNDDQVDAQPPNDERTLLLQHER